MCQSLLHWTPYRAPVARNCLEQLPARDQRHPLLLHPGVAADAAREGEPEAGVVADGPGEVRSRGLLWRHRHARVQPGTVHHGTDPGPDFRAAQDVRGWTATG